jgi:preprotein translocase subunit SecG
MYSVLIVLHLMVCFFLIFIVLIQSSKGAELGAAFGGSNQTLFGSRGAATFLNKLTTGVAVAFMLTSLFLAVTSAQRGSIMPETTPAPELPAAQAPLTETVPEPVESQIPESTPAPVQETVPQPPQSAE